MIGDVFERMLEEMCCRSGLSPWRGKFLPLIYFYMIKSIPLTWVSLRALPMSWRGLWTNGRRAMFAVQSATIQRMSVAYNLTGNSSSSSSVVGAPLSFLTKSQCLGSRRLLSSARLPSPLLVLLENQTSLVEMSSLRMSSGLCLYLEDKDDGVWINTSQQRFIRVVLAPSHVYTQTRGWRGYCGGDLISDHSSLAQSKNLASDSS